MSPIPSRYSPVRVALFLTMLLQLGSACHSDDSDPATGADGGASIESLTKAFCKAARNCCGLAGLPPEPLADCESEYDRQFDYVALVAKGTVKIDEPAFRACVAVFDEVARTCSLPPAWCPPFTSGTVAEGGSCEDVEECSGVFDRPTVCVKTGVMPDSGPMEGVCKAITIGGSGEGCSSSCPSGKVCSSTFSTSDPTLSVRICREEDGLYCDSNRRCASIVADGAACSTSEACGSASYCDTVCKPRKASGEACVSFSECARGFVCTSGRCAALAFANADLCSGNYN